MVSLFFSLMIGPFYFSLFPLQTGELFPSGNLVVAAQELYSPWNRAFGGIDSDQGYAVVEVSTGGFACVGDTWSQGAGYNDVWLVCTAADGSPIWSQTFGGSNYETGWAVLEASSGGLVIAGETYSFGTGLSDGWLLHTDATGNLLWNKTHGGQGSDVCKSLVEVSSGGFAIGGTTDNIDTASRDFWLLRTDATGVHQWNQTYGGAQPDEGEAVLEVSGGGFAIAGWTSSVGFGAEDVWLVRSDTNGNLLWSRNYGGKLSDYAFSAIEVSTGGFLLVGGTGSFGAGNMDVWVLRTNAFGDLIWNQTYGGPDHDIGNAVIELSTGNFCIAATTHSYGGGIGNVWLLGIDSAGTPLWNQTFGGSIYEEASSIIEVSTGGFAIIGSTSSYGAGEEDVWLLHVTTIGLIPPISFELFVVLIGTLIVITTVGVIWVYRRRTAII
jgi:hypothetical protein